MSFPRLPVFLNSADVWHAPNTPPAAPDMTTVCQLYLTSRGPWGILAGDNTQWPPALYLRVPKGTDLRVGDTILVSGWYYTVRWTERVHLGMVNEYFVGIIEQQVGFIPPPPPPLTVLTWTRTNPGIQWDSVVPAGAGWLTLVYGYAGAPSGVISTVGAIPAATNAATKTQLDGVGGQGTVVQEQWSCAGGEHVIVNLATDPLARGDVFGVYVPGVGWDGNATVNIGSPGGVITFPYPLTATNNLVVVSALDCFSDGLENYSPPFAANQQNGPEGVMWGGGTSATLWSLLCSYTNFPSASTPTATYNNTAIGQSAAVVMNSIQL